ncbi:MAG: YceD family protein [Pseudomonadota bacterium]|nr:YceD family protein [Pseudomonadota bacterium]
MLTDHIGISHLRELATKEESLNTSVSAFDMPRLRDLIHPKADETNQLLELEISFKQSSGADLGFPEIFGILRARLQLTCQRCLGLVLWSEKLPLRLIVVENELMVDQLSDPYDSIIADQNGIRLISIVEDELLSALPLALMHDEIDCEIKSNKEIKNKNFKKIKEDINRPFADLADLLKKSPEGDDV